MVVLPNIRRKYMVSRLPIGATVDMSECVVTLDTDSVPYTGSARTVGVSVTWQGATLAVNTDYTIAYSGNVNIGAATVTVTGMGQFVGSATRTFYIVPGSSAPWLFDLANAELADSAEISTNGGYALPLVEEYGVGYAMLPLHRWSSGSYVVGHKIPRDGDGELHLANIVSVPEVLDGSGLVDFQHPFHFDQFRSGWLGNSSSKVLKMSTGSTFDFTDAVSESFNNNYQPCFADGGRIIFIFESSMKIVSFRLTSPYDLSTVDVSSKKTVDHFLGISAYTRCLHCSFSPDGQQALVCTSRNSTIYHVSLDAPYDFSDATMIGSLATESGCRTTALANGGRTLVVGGLTIVYEYSLF